MVRITDSGLETRTGECLLYSGLRVYSSFLWSMFPLRTMAEAQCQSKKLLCLSSGLMTQAEKFIGWSIRGGENNMPRSDVCSPVSWYFLVIRIDISQLKIKYFGPSLQLGCLYIRETVNTTIQRSLIILRYILHIYLSSYQKIPRYEIFRHK